MSRYSILFNEYYCYRLNSSIIKELLSNKHAENLKVIDNMHTEKKKDYSDERNRDNNNYTENIQRLSNEREDRQNMRDNERRVNDQRHEENIADLNNQHNQRRREINTQYTNHQQLMDKMSKDHEINMKYEDNKLIEELEKIEKEIQFKKI